MQKGINFQVKKCAQTAVCWSEVASGVIRIGLWSIIQFEPEHAKVIASTLALLGGQQNI